MRIAVDTNILLRSVVRVDVAQAETADRALSEASSIAVKLPCICEFVWVLRRVYGFSPHDVASAIQAWLNTGNVVLNRAAIEAGLACLRIGIDFGDGVIAYEGRWLGCETFVSFDRRAVAQLIAQGYSAQLLA